jgi:hypothetical protein
MTRLTSFCPSVVTLSFNRLTAVTNSRIYTTQPAIPGLEIWTLQKSTPQGPVLVRYQYLPLVGISSGWYKRQCGGSSWRWLENTPGADPIIAERELTISEAERSTSDGHYHAQLPHAKDCSWCQGWQILAPDITCTTQLGRDPYFLFLIFLPSGGCRLRMTRK